jgi:putative flippase GtrA
MWRSRNLQFVRFIISGVINSLFGWVCFSLGIFLGLSVFSALALGTTLGAAFNYFTHSTITFGDLDFRKIPAFAAVYIFIITLNYVTLTMMMWVLPDPIWAQLIVTPFIAIVSYLIFSRLVFVN